MKGRATFKVWRWDGKRIAAHRGGIPLDDRGFRYGQHLFESIAVRNGSALLAREHLSLLSAAAKRHAIPFSRSLASSLRYIRLWVWGASSNEIIYRSMILFYITRIHFF